MFSKLIASDRDGASWIRNPWAIGASVLAHVALLGGLVWAADTGAGGEPADEIDPEEVTYVDVSEFPEPPEPEPAPESERAEPPAPSDPAPAAAEEAAPAPRQPREAPEEPTAPDEPAGFQELEVPEELSGIPEPQAVEPVDPEDFGGRGTPGGRAGGEPPEDAAGAGGEGAGAGGAGGEGEGAGGGAGGEGTFVAATVDRQPQLTNRGEIARMLQQLYPERLRDMGIEGRVVVQFVIDSNGRVEQGSVRILSASNDGFAGPAREVVDDMRFRPARVGGRNVRMLTQMPITFTVQ